MLRALAAYDEARRELVECNWGANAVRKCRDALWALDNALKAERAVRAAVPVLPDESERDVSPHRFKAARGMEPL